MPQDLPINPCLNVADLSALRPDRPRLRASRQQSLQRTLQGMQRRHLMSARSIECTPAAPAYDDNMHAGLSSWRVTTARLSSDVSHGLIRSCATALQSSASRIALSDGMPAASASSFSSNARACVASPARLSPAVTHCNLSVSASRRHM